MQSEVFIVNFTLWAVIPLVIYLDATTHRIGRVSGRFSFSAETWAALTMIPVAGFVFFVGYLVTRDEMLSQAEHHPAIARKWRRGATGVLIVLYGLMIAFLLSGVG